MQNLPAWFSGGAVLVTAILAYLTFRRGKTSDHALDVAANIQSTYDTTMGLVDRLRDELREVKRELETCHKERAQYRDEVMTLSITVERHERTIQEMQAD